MSPRAAVPTARRPDITASRRIGKPWASRISDDYTQAWPTATGQTTTTLHRGLMVAEWSGSRGYITATRDTWDALGVEDAWWDELDDLKREAVDTMPKAVMRDVSVAAATRGHATVQPGRAVPTADVGITALNAEIVRLVRDMAAYDKPTAAVQAEFARRYGRYRDVMATLRQQFIEAEGAFETAQVMLIGFMDEEP